MGTVKKGNQLWMAENLNFKTDTGSACYSDKIENCEKYGRLYYWKMSLSVCPAGWHLPDTTEWLQLIQLINLKKGPFTKDKNGNWRGIDKYFKNTNGWNTNDNGTNDFGFTALPAGYINVDKFSYGMGIYAAWWSSTVGDKDCAWIFDLQGGFGVLTSSKTLKTHKLSVRCIKNK